MLKNLLCPRAALGFFKNEHLAQGSCALLILPFSFLFSPGTRMGRGSDGKDPKISGVSGSVCPWQAGCVSVAS